MITVALFGEDSSFDRRRHFGDIVLSALQQAGLGNHIGGGSMVTQSPNYNIEFAVTDVSQALTLIRDVLRASSVGEDTELLAGPCRYNVYDDTWTDLGPRPKSPPTPATAGFQSTSSADFLAKLKQIADDARAKYGGPKDPNRKG